MAATTAGCVDGHAHVFPAAVVAPADTDDRWPVLAVDDDTSGRVLCGDTVFRRVTAPLWDVEVRLTELDAAGVTHQLVSPMPVLLTYWADASAAVIHAQAVNDGIAVMVRQGRTRLTGLGTVPLQDVDASVTELRRVMTVLGLRGVEIGTHVGPLELDDVALEPFWSAADALGAAVFVHPMDGGGGSIRRSGQPYDFGLGMLTDTAMAATALVFGGVLERHPGLRVALAHGGGTFPWAYPRLRLGSSLVGDQRPEHFDALTRRLWVDALVFDPDHLGLLIQRFGADHVMLGTDHPFVHDQLAQTQRVLHQAVQRGLVDPSTAEEIRSVTALAFAGAAAVG